MMMFFSSLPSLVSPQWGKGDVWRKAVAELSSWFCERIRTVSCNHSKCDDYEMLGSATAATSSEPEFTVQTWELLWCLCGPPADVDKTAGGKMYKPIRGAEASWLAVYLPVHVKGILKSAPYEIHSCDWLGRRRSRKLHSGLHKPWKTHKVNLLVKGIMGVAAPANVQQRALSLQAETLKVVPELRIVVILRQKSGEYLVSVKI